MFPTFQAAEAKYTSLDQSDSKGTAFSERLCNYTTRLRDTWREAAIVCLSILCAGLVLERILSSLKAPTAPKRVSEYKTNSGDDRWVQFQWSTGVYSSEDPDDADAVNQAWADIVPAYGFVAVDHTWAAEHHLPASMSLPSDSSKGVYILDAYHQIHCLTIIRQTLLDIDSHRSPRVPLQHSWHCFDSLLQYIVCGTSGDTLLYTWGRNQTGDGQVRKCLDWKSRKEWIRERTACYRDSERPIRLIDHFTRCEAGEKEAGDGIRLDMW
ncbi:hypothetical protein BJX63DRAFT_71184 [Aspergillus granulosus]|uniref:Uncharacterized protein n=1 Tax=Aspergillus granulosus TaxID=176169 RepID=A0ABR4HS82_9EURO